MSRLPTAGALALLLAGCSGATPQCPDLVVSFDAPMEGDMVDATVEVAIRLADGSGTPVEIDASTLATRLTTDTAFSEVRHGKSTGLDTAAFDAVTLEPGENLLKVTAQKAGTACVSTKTITVEVAYLRPRVLTLSLPQDLNRDHILDETELIGAAPLQVALSTEGAIGGTVEILEQSSMNSLSAVIAVTDPDLTVEVPATALRNGNYTLFARLTHGAVNDPSNNPAAVRTMTLARAAPTCAITLPAGPLVGRGDDAVPATPAFELRTAGTASPQATTLELKLAGGTGAPQTSGPQAPDGGALSWDFTLPRSGTTGYTVSFEARDALGNVCSATQQVTADFEAPALVLVAPDGGVETEFNLPLSATVDGGEGGFVSWQVTDSTGTRDLGRAAVDGGFAARVGSFLAGAQVLSATATDAVGNVSAPVTRPFTVSPATGCSLVITQPATRPAVISGPGPVVFQAISSCPDGTPINLTRNGISVGTQNLNTGFVSWSVPITPGTFLFRAQPAIGTLPPPYDELDVIVQ